MTRHREFRRRGAAARLLRAVGRGVVTVAILGYRLLKAIFAPLLRPLWRWLARLPLFSAIGAWIGRQHPYVVLVLLGVPFAIIEPAKVFAVYWGAVGHPLQGTILLVVAEILSLLVCERIFHAGHAPLMRIGWFARLIAWLAGLRDSAMSAIRASAPWRWAQLIWRWLRRTVRA